MTKAICITTALCLGTLGACGDEAAEAALEPPILDGKSDAAERVEQRGPLGFGEAGASGRFSEDLAWHGYVLAVRDDAVVTVEVTQKGTSRGLDTTLFLYGPMSAEGAYGTAAVAFDDDSGWGRLSRLKGKRLAGGQWLVVVGTRDGRGRGDYRVEARCDSGECAPEQGPAGACDARFVAAIEACVADWLADPDYDAEAQAHEELIAQCADVEPMAPVRDEICAEAGAPAGLCGLDMEAFHVDYLPGCRRAAVDAHLDGACVFGERYRDLFDRAEAVVIVSERRLEDPAALSALEVEQVVEAVRATAYDDVTSVEEAFAAVDDNVVNQLEVWDASNRKAYTVYEVGAGDNSFGVVFAYGTMTAVAHNNDGDWYGCEVGWGPERRRCEADADCEGKTRCLGRSESSPLGRCLDAARDDHPAEGEACTIEEGWSSCPGGAGLVCAGAAHTGAGLCLPAWMRGAFTSEPELAIPDAAAGGVEAQLLVYGLASVDMDVALDLAVSHGRTSDLRVTLTNPAGTEVVVFDGASAGDGVELWWDRVAVRGFSGDEQVNGVWTLKVVDRSAGQSGRLVRFGLLITSRWD